MNKGSLRVLIIPDYLGWAFGTMARQIQQWNPQYECHIISSSYILQHADQFAEASKGFDLIHYLVPAGLNKMRDLLGPDSAYVSSIHHVIEWDKLADAGTADAIMVVSDEWRQFIEEQGVPREKIVRVPLGTDTDRFSPPSLAEKTIIRKRLRIPEQAFVIGSFGKQSPYMSGRKGADVLLAALRSLAKTGVQLLTIGMGWQTIAKDLHKHGLSVKSVSYVEDSELPDMYRTLDCYWVTSRVEGGPLPLLESMSAGLPVITTPVGLARDIVVDGVNAMIVPKDDPDGFCKNTLALIHSKGLRHNMGRAARETIVDGYQWREYANNIPVLYDTAMANRSEKCGKVPDADDRRAIFDSFAENDSRRIEEQMLWIKVMRRSGERKWADKMQRELRREYPSMVPYPSLVPGFLSENGIVRRIKRLVS